MDTSQPYRRREFKLARDVHLRRPDFRPIPILVTLYENRITSPVMRGLRSHSPLHQEDVFGLVEGVRILVLWALQLVAPHSHPSHRHREGVFMFVDQVNFVVS